MSAQTLACRWVRDLTPTVDCGSTSEGINGTVNGSTVTGTVAETANVVESGTGNAAGILTVNSSFVATRR